jgi:SAM-dependent methyltransferase
VGYLRTVYSEKRRPYTSYPGKLCKYLVDLYFKPDYKTLLDVGCGRGEHLKEFQKLGYEVKGVDSLKEAQELSPDIEIKLTDVETDVLPFADNTFDVVFNKSLIEHLNNPENFMRESYRVLKPGGRLITMTPDWESIYKIFYEDYTHKTPFIASSLRDIHQIFGFKNVEVRKFRQLPILWKYPFLNIFSRIAYYLPKSNIKFIRFSKEIMLLGCAEKESSHGNKEL